MRRPRHFVTCGAPFFHPRRRTPLVALALFAFALRALIPMGFMPAADGTLSLTICDDGFPTWLLPHPARGAHGTSPTGETRMAGGAAMRHGASMPYGRVMPDGPGQHSHQDHCLFCSGSTPGPAPLLMDLARIVFVAISIAAIAISLCAAIRLVHVPQARAPPAIA